LFPEEDFPRPAQATLLEDLRKLQTLFCKSLFRKAALASAFLGGFLLFAGAPGAKANAWDDCHRRPANVSATSGADITVTATATGIAMGIAAGSCRSQSTS